MPLADGGKRDPVYEHDSGRKSKLFLANETRGLKSKLIPYAGDVVGLSSQTNTFGCDKGYL